MTDHTITLPCLPGDTVYIIVYSLALRRKIVAEGECIAVKIHHHGYEVDVAYNGITISGAEYGVKVFADRASAENTL